MTDLHQQNLLLSTSLDACLTVLNRIAGALNVQSQDLHAIESAVLELHRVEREQRDALEHMKRACASAASDLAEHALRLTALGR